MPRVGAFVRQSLVLGRGIVNLDVAFSFKVYMYSYIQTYIYYKFLFLGKLLTVLFLVTFKDIFTAISPFHNIKLTFV